MLITSEALKAKGAIPQFLDDFEQEWPQGMEVSAASLLRAAELRLDLVWLAQYFLPIRLLKEFDHQVAPLSEEYHSQLAPLWQEYERQIFPLQDELHRKVIPLQEEYYRRVAPLIWKILQRQQWKEVADGTN